jgi:hypothetical protein
MVCRSLGTSGRNTGDISREPAKVTARRLSCALFTARNVVARNYAAAAEITKGRQVWLMVALMYGIGTKVQTESPNVPTGSDLGTMAGTMQVESLVAVRFATAGKAEGLKSRISIDRPAVVATRLDCGMTTSKQDVGQGVDPAGRHVHQVAAAALRRGTRIKSPRPRLYVAVMQKMDLRSGPASRRLASGEVGEIGAKRSRLTRRQRPGGRRTRSAQTSVASILDCSASEVGREVLA